MPKRANPRRRALHWALGVGGVAIATAGTFAVISAAGGSAPAPIADPPVSVSVLMKLTGAAQLSGITAVNQPLRPGQFLKITTVTEQLIKSSTAQTTAEPEPRGPETCAAFSTRNVTHMYVPADRSDDWIVASEGDVITEHYGPKGEEFETAYSEVHKLAEPTVWSHPNGVVSPDPTMSPEAESSVQSDTFDFLRADYASMPRDPDELYAWFEALNGTPNPYNGPMESQVANLMLRTLEWNLPPADLRGPMIEAIAKSGAYEMLWVSDQTVILTSTKGAYVTTFVIDTRNGNLVSNSLSSGDEGGLIPIDIASSATSLTMEVVDEAPEPAGVAPLEYSWAMLILIDFEGC